MIGRGWHSFPCSRGPRRFEGPQPPPPPPPPTCATTSGGPASVADDSCRNQEKNSVFFGYIGKATVQLYSRVQLCWTMGELRRWKKELQPSGMTAVTWVIVGALLAQHCQGLQVVSISGPLVEADGWTPVRGSQVVRLPPEYQPRPAHGFGFQGGLGAPGFQHAGSGNAGFFATAPEAAAAAEEDGDDVGLDDNGLFAERIVVEDPGLLSGQSLQDESRPATAAPDTPGPKDEAEEIEALPQEPSSSPSTDYVDDLGHEEQLGPEAAPSSKDRHEGLKHKVASGDRSQPEVLHRQVIFKEEEQQQQPEDKPPLIVYPEAQGSWGNSRESEFRTDQGGYIDRDDGGGSSSRPWGGPAGPGPAGFAGGPQGAAAGPPPAPGFYEQQDLPPQGKYPPRIRPGFRRPPPPPPPPPHGFGTPPGPYRGNGPPRRPPPPAPTSLRRSSTDDGGDENGEEFDDGPQQVGPQGVGPQQVGPQGGGPPQVGPQGGGPQQVGPQGGGPPPPGPGYIPQQQQQQYQQRLQFQQANRRQDPSLGPPPPQDGQEPPYVPASGEFFPPPPRLRPRPRPGGVLAGITNLGNKVKCAAEDFASDQKLRDEAFVRRQLDCVLDKGPCDDMGIAIKRLAPDVIKGNCPPPCDECSRKQIQKIMATISREYPRQWSEMIRTVGGAKG